MEPTKRPIPIRSSFGVKAAGVWFCAVVSSVEITAVLYPYVAFMVGTYLYLLHELGIWGYPDSFPTSIYDFTTLLMIASNLVAI